MCGMYETSRVRRTSKLREQHRMLAMLVKMPDKVLEKLTQLEKCGEITRLLPMFCVSLFVAACSSSDGASPNLAGGVDSTTSVPSTSGNAGVAGTGIPEGSGGDTGGTNTDGVGTTGGATDIVGAAAIPVMQGEWATGCLELGTVFRRQTLSIVGARMLTELSAFSDQNCTMPVSIGLSLNGSTVQRNATTVPTGGTRTVSLGEAIEVNFYFEQGTLDNKPLPSADIPGAEDFSERIEYDIVLVQGDVLYLGDSNLEGYPGTSAQTRPISLNTLFFYNRAP